MPYNRFRYIGYETPKVSLGPLPPLDNSTVPPTQPPRPGIYRIPPGKALSTSIKTGCNLS